MNRRRAAVMSAIGLAGLALAGPGSAQSLKSVKRPPAPLVLQARGSFFVGGERIELSAAEIGTPTTAATAPPDSVTINQMYVEFMTPAGRTKTPVVMVHGAGLSGKSYDTTPDGRMGWYEYFVRKGHPTYVVDQVGRARSGFNSAPLNRRLAGEGAGQDPTRTFRFGERVGVWTNFRFGPRFGVAFPESQFPVEAVDELGKQAIPDLTVFVPQPNPTPRALAQLAADLDGAVLLSHSQSGPFPLDAALIDPKGIRGIVAVEPGNCRNDVLSDEQIARLARTPILIVFGDYLPVPTGYGPLTWQARMEGCQKFAARIEAARGRADILHTPSAGIRGNSHMLMQDRNSDRIADLILKWIDAHARRPA